MKNVKYRMQNLFRSAYSTIVAPATKNVSSFRVNPPCGPSDHLAFGRRGCILHSAFLNRRQTNNGIALIMVLGLLTVMILMAVTFAITMRTERLAAGNNADNVRARELVHVALARAMNDIQNNLCLPDRIIVGRDANPKITVMGGGTWELNDLAVFETPGTFPAPITINRPYQISYSGGKDVRLNDVLTTEGILPDTVMPSEDFLYEALTDSLKVSGIRLYYRGTPVYLTGNINTYYVIPVDQTHIKLANSYENALQGTAITIVAPGTLNLKPIHYMIPVHTIDFKSPSPVNTLVLNKTCKFKTGDAVIYYSPAPYTTDGKVYYVRVVEGKTIQLADSYNKAILGDCLNVVAFDLTGYLKKHGFLAPPWPGCASYTTNAIRSISEISELVTFNAVSQVIVKNRYRTGDCIAFTSTNPLPSPLEEKTPYYVISDSADKIRLATSIDHTQSAPPVSIVLSGGSGNHRMYLTMLSGEVTNYIPMSLYAGVSTAACEAVTNTYVDITTTVSTNTDDKILLGKYRYLVADCSGLLDVNLIGSSTMERRFGTNTEEIAIENLPEIGANFLNNRNNTYIRYETMRELAVLNARPTNLFVYSYCPSERWNTDMLNFFAPVNLAGDAAALVARKSAITNAFQMAGVTEKDYQECLYRSLIDYVDDDKVPNHYVAGAIPAPMNYLELPSNEKIPMINEIKFYHKLTTTYDDSALPTIKRKYQYEGKITFEIWWPFVNRPSDDADFTFDYTIDCTLFVPIQATPAGSILPTDFAPQIWSGAPVIVNGSALQFRSQRPFINIETTIPASETPFIDNNKIDSLQLDFTIKAQVKSVTDGVFVDAINNYTASFRMLPIDGQSGFVEDVRDLECLDPRYNWDIGIDKYWRYVVQSFVNQAGSSDLTLSDYSAGRSFLVGDPVAVIGSSLPNTVPALIAGKIYWINSKIGGNITIKDEAGTIISFTDPGFGKNYIKAVLDQCSLVDLSNKRFITARPYPATMPPTTKVRFSGVNAVDEYTVTSYDPKTRIFDATVNAPGVIPIQSDANNAYVRDVSDNSIDSLNSVNSVNYWTLSYLDPIYLKRDIDPYMCVENAQLKSVTELGHLIYSHHTTDPAKIEPWKSVAFYGDNPNKILDVFAVGDDNGASDFVTTAKRGLFNPNVSNVDCLATVLSEAYVDDFNDTTIMNSCTMLAADEFKLQDVPLDAPPHPLDRYYFTGMPITFAGAFPPLDTKKVYYVIYKDHDKFNVATSYEDAKNNIVLPVSASANFLVSPAKLTMAMAGKMAPKMARGSCTNYSQLANALTNFDFGADSDFPYPATDLEKESLLGHNIGLLSLRQNVFAIIIEVQAASGGNIPRNAAKQRAVAIVWRDPYTGEMFIRHIKWLGD